MNDKLVQIFQSIFPFLILGVAVSLLIGLFIFFSWVLVWGFFLGCILWIGALIKNFLFPSKEGTKTEGRVIEHDDKK